jgi:hypothetical protein
MMKKLIIYINIDLNKMFLKDYHFCKLDLLLKVYILWHYVREENYNKLKKIIVIKCLLFFNRGNKKLRIGLC